MKRIPEQSKNWRGIFRGNFIGDLWQTFNIDLEKSLGRLRLGDKFRILTDSGDVATLGIPYKFLRTNASATDQWWCLSSTAMLKTAGTNAFVTYAADAISGTTPVDGLDMETHEDANGEQRLVVSRATDIAILNRTGAANTWTSSWWDTTLAQDALGSAVYHPLVKLQRLLIIGDQNKIHTIDKDDVVSASRVVLPSGFEARCAVASSDRVWIGFQNNFGGQGVIVEWDGFSLSYNNVYNIVGSYPLTVFMVNNIPYCIDETGYIYKFTGYGFAPDQEFPMVAEKLTFTGSTLATTATIVPHGVAVDRHLAYINVGAPTTSRRMRSGVWVYNTQNKNLTHLRGLSQHKTAGTDLAYGGTPFFRPGALKLIVDGANSVYDLLAGASVYTVYTGTTLLTIQRTVANELQASNEGRNRGYFITPFIPAGGINDYFQELWLKFRRFLNSNNRIIVYYRVLDPDRDQDNNDETVQQVTGTWVDTTSFTAAVPTGVVVGDLVEVMAGANSGCIEPISTLSATPDGSTSITVTLSNAVPTSSTAAFLARFDNWVLVDTITSTSRGNQPVNFPSNPTGEFIQLLVELRGFSNELDEMVLTSKDNQKI